MKKGLIILILITIFFTSCEIKNKIPEGKINFISVALNYKNTNVNTLYGTLNDGREIEKAFRLNSAKTHREYSSFCFYQQNGDYSLETINNNYYPSVENILHCIERLSKTSNKNDLTIFSYSGHGYKEKGSLVLATTDYLSGKTLLDDGVVDKSTLLTPDVLLEKLKRIKGNKLLIIDSCYSGIFQGDSQFTLDNSKNDVSFVDIFNKFISNQEIENNNIYILCATEEDNYSHEQSDFVCSHPHGYFSKALLEGLGWCYGEKGKITNKTVTYLTDNEGIQGVLAQGLPPSLSSGRTLSVDKLYKYIKYHQDIPFIKIEGRTSHQMPKINLGRKDLILFNY